MESDVQIKNAEKDYEQYVNVLGNDHPDTLISLNNLADLFKDKGDYESALPLYKECLAKRRLVLGNDHPDTLTSIFNLATLFKNKRDYYRALPLYEEWLSKRTLALGENHPATRQSNMIYINFLREMGKNMQVSDRFQSVVFTPEAEGGGTKKKDTSLERVRNLSGLSGVELEEVVVEIFVIIAVQVKNIKRLANPVERIVGTRANIECRRMRGIREDRVTCKKSVS